MFCDTPARPLEIPRRRREQIVVRIAGESPVAGVGLHRREDGRELVVGGHFFTRGRSTSWTITVTSSVATAPAKM